MFNTLILPHLSKIKSWVSYFAERKSECDDIYQEVLIEIFKNIEQAAQAANLPAWLYTLTRRKVRRLNIYRRRDHDHWAEPPSPDFYDQLPDNSSPGLEATTRTSATAQLQDSLLLNALDTLSPMQREIMLARAEDESQTDIANRLGIPLNTVENYENTARAALEEYLQPALARRRKKARLPRHKRKS